MFCFKFLNNEGTNLAHSVKILIYIIHLCSTSFFTTCNEAQIQATEMFKYLKNWDEEDIEKYNTLGCLLSDICHIYGMYIISMG